MANLAEFLRMFLSYGLVLVICAGLMVGGAFIGIGLRKSKNSKEALTNVESVETEN